jgi:hypothetical protein
MCLLSEQQRQRIRQSSFSTKHWIVFDVNLLSCMCQFYVNNVTTCALTITCTAKCQSFRIRTAVVVTARSTYQGTQIGCIMALPMFVYRCHAVRKPANDVIASGRMSIGGADKTVAARNQTPLHFAVRYRHVDVTKLLLQNGCDVNAAEKMRIERRSISGNLIRKN